MKCTFGLVLLNAELVFGALDGIDVGGGTDALVQEKINSLVYLFIGVDNCHRFVVAIYL